MRRVVSLFLPSWPTDRLSRRSAVPSDEPLVIAMREGSRRIVAAADGAARRLGLAPGLTIAHAQALVPGLRVVEATPQEDAAALARLAGWCLRYAPAVALDPPDGLFVEIAGAAHLLGGEAALVQDVITRLAAGNIAGQAAVAGTPGGAWALARFGTGATIVPTGRLEEALAPLPVAALRLAPETIDALRRLGLERIGDVAALPRGPLARRLGPDLLRRLDQALGRVGEPLDLFVPPDVPCARLVFAEPISTPDDLARVIAHLTADLCRTLETRGLGARRLDLLFERVDRRVQAARVGTARPSRDPRHLAKLLAERLPGVDPGFGIERAILLASRAEPFMAHQLGNGNGAGEEGTGLVELVDRIAVRVGEGRVYRLAPVESTVPERSVKRVGALAPPVGASWPPRLPRPSRLLDPPEPVEAIALLPDRPPAVFVWRAVRRRVLRADGPERIFGEWWRFEAETASLRDYYRVEDETGARFWLFRDAPPRAGGRWWLHGVFG